MTTSKPPSGDLSIIEAEVDANVYDYFVEDIEKLKNEKRSAGIVLTDIIEVYLVFMKKFREKNKNIDFENLEKHILTTQYVIIKDINIKTHQKFRKYIKKKYKGQNFEQNYRRELNTALWLYVVNFVLPLRIREDALNNIIRKNKRIPLTYYVTNKIPKEELQISCKKHNITLEEAESIGIL